jgi:hypothetical protein
VYGPKLFSNLTAFYSSYDYALNIEAESTGDEFKWRSTIQNLSFKPEFTWYANDRNTVTFGGQVLHYNFLPSETKVSSNGVPGKTTSRPRKYAFENSIYISNDQEISKRFSITYGLRYSNFLNIGPGNEVILGDTTPGIRRPYTINKVASGKIIAQYGNFEPRFSAKYQLNEESSVKISYNRMAQYIHLLSNTQASVPLDVWNPSSNNIRPQIGDQAALGYFRNFSILGIEYEFSAEGFYKEMQHQIDYIDGAELLRNEALEAELLSGDGRAYGLELYLKKRKGRLNGWVSYTLSRSERRVEGINSEAWYPTRFDRTHNLYAVGNFELSPRWSISSNFVFSSGVPGTFPTNRIEYQGYIVPHNNQNLRNNYRIPAYHRLDLSITWDPKKNENRRWKGTWNFTIYNVYSRRNPFGIYFRQQPPPDDVNASVSVDQPRNTQAVRFSVLGIPVPAITYNFSF